VELVDGAGVGGGGGEVFEAALVDKD